jgi:type I restriction enzyme, S subunit
MPTNLGDNVINPDGISRIGNDDVRRLSRHQLRAGDIVLSRRGDVGRRAIVRPEQKGWLCGTGCLAVRFGRDIREVNPEYVAHYIGTRGAQTWLIDNAVGATMLNLNTGILGALPIALPTRAHQDRVVQALDDSGAQVLALEELLVKKRNIQQGTMQRLFIVERDASGSQELGSFTRFLSGGTPPLETGSYWNGSIPWISALTLKGIEVSDSDRRLTPTAVAAGSKMAPLGSTLLLVRGSALHSEIRASLVVRPVCFNQDVKALVPNSEIVPKFLTYSIHANADRLLRSVTSAGNTAGVLDTKVLKAWKLWVPEKPEQARIVQVMDDIAKEVDALQRRLDSARAIRQGMMQELLTGQTRLTDEVAT